MERYFYSYSQNRITTNLSNIDNSFEEISVMVAKALVKSSGIEIEN